MFCLHRVCRRGAHLKFGYGCFRVIVRVTLCYGRGSETGWRERASGALFRPLLR